MCCCVRVAAQILRQWRLSCLVGQYGQIVHDALLIRQPMQLLECSSKLAIAMRSSIRHGVWFTITPRCFVLAAASEWGRMECRTAQRCSSRFWKKSDYMQASVLSPVLVDDVCGGLLLRGYRMIAPRLTRAEADPREGARGHAPNHQKFFLKYAF